MKDLTTGNETKLLILFTIPMLLGNVFQQLYNTVDSIIVGRFIGIGALGAVGVAFPVIFLLISLIMGGTMGMTVLVSQYAGAKDSEKIKKTIDTGLIYLFYTALFVTLAGILFSRHVLLLLKTPETILEDAVLYLRIIFAGTFFMFGYNAVSAILRGLGDSKNPLYYLIIATVLNILLDLLFVVAFGWGIGGAAWATVLSQAISFAFSVRHLKNHKYLHFSPARMKFDNEIFRRSMKIGIPSGIQGALVSVGMMVVTAIVNGFGENAIAAFSIAIRLDSFAAMPLMTFAMALSTFTGQNLGAGKKHRVKKGLYSSLFFSIAIALIVSMVLIPGRYVIPSIFTNNREVLKLTADYLFIIGSFYFLFAIMTSFGGILRGAGETVVPMFATILALWVIRVPVAHFLSQSMGIKGVWWSIPAGWAGGCLVNTAYYFTGRWQKAVVVKPPLLEEPLMTEAP